MSINWKLSNIFAITNYDDVSVKDLLKQVCCLHKHYTLILDLENSQCYLTGTPEKVEQTTLVSVLECALTLLNELDIALQNDQRSGATVPNNSVITIAKCLFDYLAETPELAILDANNEPVPVQDDASGYTKVCSYGVYLAGSCCGSRQLRYLTEC